MSKINYFSIGGQDERWKYSGILEINNDIFICNIGVSCSINNEYGINKAIPDLTYLKSNLNKIKALFIGTPRNLNIAALPYLLDLCPNIPIYTSFIGKEIIHEFLEEFSNNNKKKYSPTFVVVNPANEVAISSIRVCPVKIANSIPNSYVWTFKTNDGENIIFVDEFLVSNDNIPCSENQLHIVTQQSKNKTSLLIVGTQSVGKVPSFAYQQANNFHYLKKACSSTKSRVLVAIYEDDWHTLFNLSKIAKIYSMNFHIACPKMSKLFNFYLEQIKKIDYSYSGKIIDSNDSLIVISGDHNSLYLKLAQLLTEDSEIKLKKDDLFIFSTIVYPEKEVEEINIINELSKKDIVIVKQPKTIVNYCAGDEDIKSLVNSISPFNIVPINCYYKDYVNFCKALSHTINLSRVKFLELGQAISIDGKNSEIYEVPVSEQYVNDDGLLSINKTILLERQLITQNGAILVSVLYDSKKHQALIGGLEFLGIFLNQSEKSDAAKEEIKKALKISISKYLTMNKVLEIKIIKSQIRKSVTHAIENYSHKRPLILPLITNLN